MSHEIVLTGKPKIVVLVLLVTVFLFLILNSALLHIDKAARAGLNREDLVAQIGPWLDGNMQKHETPDHWVARREAELKRGSFGRYRCTLGTIDVRGWGERPVASIIVEDSGGTRTRYFTLDWNPMRQKWICDFYNSGDNVAVHPEENGFEFIGRFFLRAHLEGSTEYADTPKRPEPVR